MSAYIHSYYYSDGEYVNNSTTAKSAEANSIVVYEVLRLMMGKPLYIEDHLERLEQSMEALGFTIDISINELLMVISDLCLKNKCDVGNVEIKVQTINGNNSKLTVGFISHLYPEPTYYISGVNTCTIEAQRSNPNIKLKGTKAREIADNKLKNSKFYEVLLVDDLGLILEGSRSNVFFIINNDIVTSPSNTVLEGITRKYVIKAIKNLGLNYTFNSLPVDQLHTVQAAFLCGTSPGVLPIGELNEYKLDTQNPTLRKVMQGFNDELKKYLS